MTRPPNASSRSSSVNTVESYRLRSVWLHARAAQRVERDVAERVHRRDRAEELRLRSLQNDHRDELRIVRRRETRERRDVRVIEVASVVARDLRGARLPGNRE